MTTVARRVNAEIVVVLGWGRAILLQLAHPLVAAGVDDHSTFRGDPGAYARRALHTIGAMLRLTFGSPQEIRATAARINGIHCRVSGRLKEPTARWPAGTPYSATDPELLRWVHATLVDTQLLTYQRLVGPLTPEEADSYCAEAAGVAPLLAIPNRWLPTTAAGVTQYLDDRYRDGTIQVTSCARRLARELLHPRGEWLAGPGLALGRLITVGLLPPHVREAYGFAWPARSARRSERAVHWIRRSRRWLPPALREWPSARVVPKS